MRRPNSSGSSNNRRGSSSRSNSTDKSFGGRGKSDKPFKKFNRKDSGKPFGRRDEKSSSTGSGSERPQKRPFSKTPFKREEDNSPEKRSRQFPSTSGGPSARPFKKFDKTSFGKGSSRRDGDSIEKRERRFVEASKETRSEKPYKKFDKKPFDKSAPRREGDSFERREKRFGDVSKDTRSEKPYKKPFDKSAARRDDTSFEKRDNDFRGTSKDERSERPYKKFDRKSFDTSTPRRDNTSFDKSPRNFEGPKETSLGRPYKKFEKRSDNKPAPEEEESREKKERSFPAESTARAIPGKRFDKSLIKKRKQEDPKSPEKSDKIRLNKFISNSGVCSRREADELITMGLISVNGTTITELGYKVNPSDEVRHEGKVLKAEKPVYILMNKPKGYLTTTSDPQERNTVMHILANTVKERVYPVGRLDRNTTGLLLLTNDGELADKLMHPSYKAKKIYKVELDRPLTKADAQKISDGVQLEEGRAMVDDVAVVSEDGRTVGIELHIGWNRVVRRIFESLLYEVVKLDRTIYAGLDKKDLPRGHWRFLTKEEIVRIKHYQ